MRRFFTKIQNKIKKNSGFLFFLFKTWIGDFVTVSKNISPAAVMNTKFKLRCYKYSTTIFLLFFFKNSLTKFNKEINKKKLFIYFENFNFRDTEVCRVAFTSA